MLPLIIWMGREAWTLCLCQATCTTLVVVGIVLADQLNSQNVFVTDVSPRQPFIIVNVTNQTSPVTIHHSFALRLEAKNIPLPRIISTVDCLPLRIGLISWFSGCFLLHVFAQQFLFTFYSFTNFLSQCYSVSWLFVNCWSHVQYVHVLSYHYAESVHVSGARSFSALKPFESFPKNCVN